MKIVEILLIMAALSNICIASDCSEFEPLPFVIVDIRGVSPLNGFYENFCCCYITSSSINGARLLRYDPSATSFRRWIWSGPVGSSSRIQSETLYSYGSKIELINSENNWSLTIMSEIGPDNSGVVYFESYISQLNCDGRIFYGILENQNQAKCNYCDYCDNLWVGGISGEVVINGFPNWDYYSIPPEFRWFNDPNCENRINFLDYAFWCEKLGDDATLENLPEFTDHWLSQNFINFKDYANENIVDLWLLSEFCQEWLELQDEHCLQ